MSLTHRNDGREPDQKICFGVRRDYRARLPARSVGPELLHPSNTYCGLNTVGIRIGAPFYWPRASKLVRDRYDADCNNSAGMETWTPTGRAVFNFARLYKSSIYKRDQNVDFSERALLHAGERVLMALTRRRECRLGTIPSGTFRGPRTRFPFREGRKGSLHSMGVTARRRHVPARGR